MANYEVVTDTSRDASRSPKNVDPEPLALPSQGFVWLEPRARSSPRSERRRSYWTSARNRQRNARPLEGSMHQISTCSLWGKRPQATEASRHTSEGMLVHEARRRASDCGRNLIARTKTAQGLGHCVLRVLFPSLVEPQELGMRGEALKALRGPAACAHSPERVTGGVRARRLEPKGRSHDPKRENDQQRSCQRPGHTNTPQNGHSSAWIRAKPCVR